MDHTGVSLGGVDYTGVGLGVVGHAGVGWGGSYRGGWVMQ